MMENAVDPSPKTCVLTSPGDLRISSNRAGKGLLVIEVDMVNPNECPHPTLERRQRTHANGVVVHGDQCLTCGHWSENGIKKDRALTDLPWYDEKLRHSFRDQGGFKTTRLGADWYHVYLQSPEWKRRRRMIMERSGGVCEARIVCDGSSSVAVHHLSYRYLGFEPLWDLAAVCDECHSFIHGKIRLENDPR
jgi:hypothetical protein